MMPSWALPRELTSGDWGKNQIAWHKEGEKMKLSKLVIVFGLFPLVFVCGGITQGADFELKFTTMMVKPHPFLAGIDHFVKRVAERTNGKVRITVFDGGKLGPDDVTLTGLQKGTIDFNWTGAAQTASYIPETNFFGLAYLFKNPEHLEKAIEPDGALAQKVAKLIDGKKLGFKFLTLSGGGIRNMSNGVRPVKSINDIKGMKMRVPPVKTMVTLWKAFGVMPTTIAWTELYPALQAGVVDAFESSTAGYRSAKLFEVAKYHAKTEHEIGVTLPLMSRKTYDKLPPEYRKIIEKSMYEAVSVCTAVGFEKVEKDLTWLKTKGAVVTEVDKEPFIKIAIPFQDETAKKYNMGDILRDIRGLAE
jgi:tripartite ATP-independent transporter DctP family solute receptor